MFNESKFIKLAYSERLNRKELEFREKIQPTDKRYNKLDKWMKFIDERKELLTFIKKRLYIKGKILELGAGSCWLCSKLSKFDNVKEVYALDISEYILTQIAPKVMNELGADTTKITRVLGDFNNLAFSEKSFDFIFFDASLHHIPLDSYIHVLKEIEKVLKPTGKIIAIREPVLPEWRKYKRKSFGKYERENGVTENIFTKQEWSNIFQKSGFKVNFIPYIHTTNKISIQNLIKKIVRIKPFLWLNDKLLGYNIFELYKIK